MKVGGRGRVGEAFGGRCVGGHYYVCVDAFPQTTHQLGLKSGLPMRCVVATALTDAVGITMVLIRHKCRLIRKSLAGLLGKGLVFGLLFDRGTQSEVGRSVRATGRLSDVGDALSNWWPGAAPEPVLLKGQTIEMPGRSGPV